MSTGALILFGGSFDPLHTGHLAIAQLALETLSLSSPGNLCSEVLFIPTSQNPLKAKSRTSAVHRLGLVKEAIADNENFHLWEGEVSTEGHSYTFDTVQSIAREYPQKQLYFLMGSDNVSSFHRWYRVSELLLSVKLMIVTRPESSVEFDPSLGAIEYTPVISPHWGVSSSTIREYLSRGLSCRYLLPTSVYNYLNDNNLYSDKVSL